MEHARKPQFAQGAKLLGTYVITLVGIGSIIFLSLSLLPLADTETPAKAPIISLD